MDITERQDLERKAVEARKDVVRMTGVARSGYLNSSLSVIDILIFLYWKGLSIHPDEPLWKERDRFVLSKSHACPALYSVLANRGFFDRKELWNFRRLGSMLQGHQETPRTPGIDASGGSPGMGLGISNGMALALRLDRADQRIVCLLGDGELQEGSLWESAMQTSNLGLDNVTAIVDMNGTQMGRRVDSIKKIEPVRQKFESFGWRVEETDGHDMAALGSVFAKVLAKSASGGIPWVVLAHTVPGKGFSMAERGGINPLQALDRNMMEQALRELESASAVLGRGEDL
ncbi:MAG TPA: transketolase [Synergistetes bacterium]|nr:transketolase [Synergistota bacterium]